jgi:arabinogalactan endo-1,4-beta-galactosidase
MSNKQPLQIQILFMQWLLFCIVACCTIMGCKNKEDNPVLQQVDNPEMKGVDLSFLPEIRASGLLFYNQQKQAEDMLLTLKKSGVNLIRLRLWKNPSSPNSDFETVKSLVQEIKALGLKTLLTVHYSDTWADPAQQSKPQQWQGIGFNQLKDSVYAYTQKITTEINPDYIQIGNEINHGLLWPDGEITNLEQMKSLLQSGILAVRATNRNTKIIIHYAGLQHARWFYQQVANLDFDWIGISYYPMWHGKNLDSLQQTLAALSTTHQKPVFIAETSYPFTLEWNDWTNNIIGLDSQLIATYPPTPQGQKDYLLRIQQLLKNVPNAIGFCYWGAEWVSYKGSTATNGSTYENQAFWDFKREVLPVLDAY